MRSVLGASLVVLVSVVAGCSSGGGLPEDVTTSSTTTTAEETTTSVEETTTTVAETTTTTEAEGGDTGAPSVGGFTELVDSDASCEELFDYRNRFDPDDAVIEDLNDQLRTIGCYSTGSERTD